MLLSKKIANVLFGKYDYLDGKLKHTQYFNHPEYGDYKYRGDDGILYTMIIDIRKLEKRVMELENAIIKRKK